MCCARDAYVQGVTFRDGVEVTNTPEQTAA